MAYLVKLLAEKGGTPGFYAEAQKHLTTFTRQQIVSKSRQLRQLVNKKAAESPAAPLIEDLTLLELEKVLPLVPPINEARKILGDIPSPVVKSGHISPLTTDPRAVNRYVKTMIKQMTSRRVRPPPPGRRAPLLVTN